LWYIKVMIRQGIFALSLQDLRPFPTHIAVSYEGHSGMVRAVAVEARWGPVGGRMDFGICQWRACFMTPLLLADLFDPML